MSRNWCFTVNNYQKSDEQSFQSRKHKYLVYGREKGEKGTPHMQGYIEFGGAKKLETLKKEYGYHIHWEVRKGTAEEASKYCKKDGDYHEDGEISKQGKRSDIIRIKEMMKQGVRDPKVYYEECTSYQALRFAEKGIELFEQKREWKSIVHWYYGPTGTGKTATAYQKYPNAWISSRDLKWWQGYNGEENVIIDDFRGDFCTFHELLRILDRYPYRVEIKGGSRQLLAKNIIVTCPYHPAEVYKNRTQEDINQLLRRIDHVELFKNNLTTEVKGNTSDLDLEKEIEKLADELHTKYNLKEVEDYLESEPSAMG